MNKENPQYVIVKNQKHGGAAILSFFIPGLGQLVKGNLFKALFFFFGTLLLMVTIVGGFLMWIWAIVDAYN